MKKLIALSTALVMMVLSLASCNGGTENTTGSASTTGNAVVDSTSGTTGTTAGSTAATVGTTAGSTTTEESTTTNDGKIDYNDFLVMHFDFDEWDLDANIVTDITGKGHDASVVGAVDIIDGIEGDAAYFGNVGDYLQVADAADLNFSANDSFTIDFWYKLDDNSFANASWPCVLAKGFPNKTSYYGLWLQKGKGLQAGYGEEGGSISNTLATSSLTVDKTWHHYVAVYDGTKGLVSTYVDGVPGATTSKKFDTTSTADLFIGITGDLSAMQQFIGGVDEFKIYSCALDYQTIAGIEVEVPDEEKAVADFDFNEIKDGKFIDKVSGMEAVISGDVSLVEGKDGNAVLFDTFGQYLTIADSDLLNFKKTQSFTIQITYKAAANLFSSNSWPCLFQKGSSGNGWYGVWFNSTNAHWGGLGGNKAIYSGITKDSDGNVTDTEWHTLTIIQDATTGTITTYCDGILGGTKPVQEYVSTLPIWIGGKVSDSGDEKKDIQQFYGAIDGFTVYNYAMDEADVVAGTIYAAEKQIYTYTDATTGETLELPYRVYYPTDYDATSSKKYPILFFLHGNGECGTDNDQQIKVLGSSNILLEDVAAMDNCIIVAPQCVDDDGVTKEWIEGEPWAKGIYERAELPENATLGLRAASALLDTFLASDKVDTDRVYGAGISMGGYGIWELMARRPETFAACVPVCGAGITGSAKDLVNIDIWAFHGDADPTVNISGTKAMFDAIKAAGGTKMTFTVLEGVNHNAWTPAYTTVNEAGQTPAQWLLQQTKAD